MFVGWLEGDTDVFVNERAGLARLLAHELMGTEPLRRAISVARMNDVAAD